MSKLTSQFIIVLLFTCIVTIIGVQSFAHRPLEQSQAALVATFDLERVFNTIDEKKAAFDTLPAIAEELEQRNKTMRKEIEDLQAELKLHVEGSPKRMEIDRKLLAKVGNYRANVEFAKMKIEAEQGKLIKRTYSRIHTAVQELAESNGYELVLVNDSLAEIPPGTIEDLNRQISARRVIYSKHDITDQLISYMNDQFKKSGGVVPTAAAKAP